VIVCGLAPPASVMEMAADASPFAAGLNVTVNVHIPLAGTIVPQVFVSGKSDDPVPVRVTVRAKGDADAFLNVAVLEGLDWPTVMVPKFINKGLRLTAVPVPLRLTDCELGLALSAMVSMPVRVFTATGVKVTVIVQLEPAATVNPQLLVCEKSPDTVTDVMERLTLPAFDSVTL